jgi:lysyl-tRNA synthetase class 2
VCVAGRLMRVRMMGKASFAHVLDATGEIQLYFKLDQLGEKGYAYFKLLDIGDIVGAAGTVFRTKTGEVTVQVDECVLLAKAYLQLPDKWHGLSDVETRYRRRYLDLISNSDARRIFLTRTAITTAVRRYLDERGFVEVETPVLQPLYGGGAANPFTTHYRELEADVYLRIADELYLKRLIVGGMERVYEIGKDFRNEGVSRKHSPEFTMLELYQSYADYADIMDLLEEMVSTVAQDALGTQVVEYQGQEIDLRPPWRRLTMQEALVKYAAMDPDKVWDRDAHLAALDRHGVETARDMPRGELVEHTVSALVEPNLIRPTILHDFPVDYPGSLLAKRKPNNPELVERFEAFMAGMEFANAFTELNDPRDQLARMEEAAKARGESHAEVDRDYILALEHGMPPTGGMGVGFDRLVMVLTNAHHIRETILFPLLRQREVDDAES